MTDNEDNGIHKVQYDAPGLVNFVIVGNFLFAFALAWEGLIDYALILLLANIVGIMVLITFYTYFIIRRVEKNGK